MWGRDGPRTSWRREICWLRSFSCSFNSLIWQIAVIFAAFRSNSDFSPAKRSFKVRFSPPKAAIFAFNNSLDDFCVALDSSRGSIEGL